MRKLARVLGLIVIAIVGFIIGILLAIIELLTRAIDGADNYVIKM